MSPRSSSSLLGRAVTIILNHVPAPLAARLGNNTRAARLLRPVVNRVVPRSHVVAVVRDGPARGIRLLIEPKAEKFYWTGQHERRVQEALAAALRPGDVFWDIGAHIGLYTMLAARAVGGAGHVHSFEPMPENRARLEESLSLNNCSNVTVHAHALAAEPGQAPLYAADSSTMWSLMPVDGGAAHVVVDCRTLDGVAKVLAPPDVIKVDAEGMELDVLRGGAQLFTRHLPVILLELLHEDQIAAARAILPKSDFRRLDRMHWLVTPIEHAEGPRRSFSGTPSRPDSASTLDSSPS